MACMNDERGATSDAHYCTTERIPPAEGATLPSTSSDRAIPIAVYERVRELSPPKLKRYPSVKASKMWRH